MPLPPRSYTSAEKRQRAALLLRGARQSIAGPVDPRIDNRIERIDARAADRAALELEALNTAEAAAERQLADAKAKERGAAPTDRTAAKRAVKDARKQLDRATRARQTYRP
jgi:hypothetical protein